MSKLATRLLEFYGRKPQGTAVVKLRCTNCGDGLLHISHNHATGKNRMVDWTCKCSKEAIAEALREDEELIREQKFEDDDEDDDETEVENPVGPTTELSPKNKRHTGKQSKKKPFKKIETVPTSTALIGRVPVFLPVAQPEHAKAFATTRKTQWGAVTVKGPRQLTQAHADVLQSLLAIKAKSKQTGTSSSPYKVVYRMADLRRMLGYRIGHAQRIQLLKDLRDVSIDLQDETGETVAYFSFIDSIKRLKLKGKPKIKLMGKWRSNPDQLYRVRLSEEFMQFCKNDTALSYPELVPIICSAKHAATKAVSRHLLTHNEQNPREKTVFKAVGAMRREDNTRFHKALIDDAPTLKALGIDHDPEKRRLKYRRNRGRVFVQKPETVDSEESEK